MIAQCCAYMLQARSNWCMMATLQILDLAEKVKIGALPSRQLHITQHNVTTSCTGGCRSVCSTCCVGVETVSDGLRRGAS